MKEPKKRTRKKMDPHSVVEKPPGGKVSAETDTPEADTDTVKTAEPCVGTVKPVAADVEETKAAEDFANGNPPRIIFVCSPYRPTSQMPECRQDEERANLDRVKKACRILVSLGFLPLAPHLYFTQFLDDGDLQEREKGMRLGLQWLEQADEVWVFGGRVSEGMEAEIRHADEIRKPVRYLPEPGRMVELLLKCLTGKEGGKDIEADTGSDSDSGVESTADAEQEQSEMNTEQPQAVESEEECE